MSASLRALLAGVIDYAGLFPPAKLPLDQAIRNYARYRQGTDAWMLGRFICPAARLTELAPFVDELFRDGPPVVVSALGRGGEEFLQGMTEDLSALAAFRERHDGRAVVDTLEVRLAPSRHPALDEPIRLLAQTGASSGAPLEAVFVEVPLTDDWQTAVPTAAAALHAVNDLHQGDKGLGSARFGFKLRCGGLEASAFPSAAQVAVVLKICHEEGVPLKFTAGLHHPLPRPDSVIGALMHGFVNVFTAAALEWSHGLETGTLNEVLADEDAADFAFDDDGLRWRDLRVSTDWITEVRQSGAVSFGSCSFDEPRDDLRSLGWLEAAP
jgi:hypothetical protein